MNKTAQKVFIIGAAGMVGSAAAQAIALKELAHEIILIDVDEARVAGQAMDIDHATAFSRDVRVRTGTYEEIADNDIVVITCGAAQKPGQSRLELVAINAKIIREVVGKVVQNGAQPFVVMVTNPVDVLTKLAYEVSGLPKHKVFGTGTILDTARLRVEIAHMLTVSPLIVNGFVLGEHGDSSFPAFSSMTIDGVPAADFPGFNTDASEIASTVRESVYKIIAAKQSTYYGIASVIVQIVAALQDEMGTILPLCSMTSGQFGLPQIAIGLPNFINRDGVKIVETFPLSADEQHKLHESAKIIVDASQNI